MIFCLGIPFDFTTSDGIRYFDLLKHSATNLAFAGVRVGFELQIVLLSKRDYEIREITIIMELVKNKLRRFIRCLTGLGRSDRAFGFVLLFLNFLKKR